MAESRWPGRYRWVVLLAAVFSVVLNFSQAFVIGVYHVALLRHFRQDASVTAWAGALVMSTLGMGGPLAGYVMDRSDCRTCLFLSGLLTLGGSVISSFAPHLWIVFISQGLISGLGFCFSFQGSVVALGLWFRGKSSGVVGVALSMSSLGMLVMGRLTQTLIDAYGLRGAYLLSGAIASHACALALLVRPAPPEVDRRRRRRHLESGSGSWISGCLVGVRSVLAAFLANCRQLPLLLLMASAFCLGGGIGLSALHSVHLFITCGMTPQNAALTVSVYGVGGAVGRGLLGGLANTFSSKALLLACACGLAGIFNFLLPVLTSGEAGMFAYTLVMGLYASSAIALFAPVVMEMVPIRHIHTSVALCYCMTGLSNLFTPFLSGLSQNLYDKFFLAGGLLSVASACSLASAVATLTDRGDNEEEEKKDATTNAPSPEETLSMMNVHPATTTDSTMDTMTMQSEHAGSSWEVAAAPSREEMLPMVEFQPSKTTECEN